MLRLLLSLALLSLAACSESTPQAHRQVAVDRALGGEADAGFARALAPRDFRFPQDHGPHPAFKNEWWYLTGNLADRNGRRFGYQVTFFRIALTPDPPLRDSAWATGQVWMAHAALSDVATRTHRDRERFARGALGLAGARAQPLRVWVEDWRLKAVAAGDRWRLLVDAGDFSLDLELEPLRPPLPQGEDGLSQKSAEPGNASYYYSITRIATRGSVTAGGDAYAVQGLSWLDREWSTSALGPGQSGWDWFSLQLDDGSDLMYYRLRRGDGSTDPHSRGSVLTADGRRLELFPRDVALAPRRWWSGPEGTRYPIEWAVNIPSLKKNLTVRALIPDQLMDLSVRYWEGAVVLLDGETGVPLGYGYLETTGY